MIGIINRCNAFQFPNDYLIACREDGMFFKSLVKSPGGCMVIEMFFLPYQDNLQFIRAKGGKSIMYLAIAISPC